MWWRTWGVRWTRRAQSKDDGPSSFPSSPSRRLLCGRGRLRLAAAENGGRHRVRAADAAQRPAASPPLRTPPPLHLLSLLLPLSDAAAAASPAAAPIHCPPALPAQLGVHLDLSIVQRPGAKSASRLSLTDGCRHSSRSQQRSMTAAAQEQRTIHSSTVAPQLCPRRASETVRHRHSQHVPSS